MSNKKESRKLKFYLGILIGKFQNILDALLPNQTPLLIRQFELLLFRLKIMLAQ